MLGAEYATSILHKNWGYKHILADALRLVNDSGTAPDSIATILAEEKHTKTTWVITPRHLSWDILQ